MTDDSFSGSLFYSLFSMYRVFNWTEWSAAGISSFCFVNCHKLNKLQFYNTRPNFMTHLGRYYPSEKRKIRHPL